jgi:hypothetical protein
VARTRRKDKRRIVRLRDLVGPQRGRRIDEQITAVRLDGSVEPINRVEEISHVASRFITGQQHAAPVQPSAGFGFDTFPFFIAMRVEGPLQILERARARRMRIFVRRRVMIRHRKKIL